MMLKSFDDAVDLPRRHWHLKVVGVRREISVSFNVFSSNYSLKKAVAEVEVPVSSCDFVQGFSLLNFFTRWLYHGTL